MIPMHVEVWKELILHIFFLILRSYKSGNYAFLLIQPLMIIQCLLFTYLGYRMKRCHHCALIYINSQMVHILFPSYFIVFKKWTRDFHVAWIRGRYRINAKSRMDSQSKENSHNRKWKAPASFLLQKPGLDTAEVFIPCPLILTTRKPGSLSPDRKLLVGISQLDPHLSGEKEDTLYHKKKKKKRIRVQSSSLTRNNLCIIFLWDSTVVLLQNTS